VLFVYLAALVVAFGVLAVQLVASGDGHDGGDAHDHELDSGWAVFLGARFWTFCFLAFGLVGTLLTLFRLATPGLVFGLAAPAGLASGLFAALTMRALRRGQATTSVNLEEAVGQVGRVLLPVGKGRVGKVRLQLKGQAVDVLATTDDDELVAGQRVVVDELRGGVAHVLAAPEELGP
jgi:membrane protein implicated in regulation of membrane protease activity